MRIDQEGAFDPLHRAPLPPPSEHAGRNREAMARLLEGVATRLLVVSSVNGRAVVLAEQDGTVLDEEIAVAGPRLNPGDKAVRLVVAGRGRRDAAPAYVAVGPVVTALGTPAATVGPVDGPAAGTGATQSVLGTDEYCILNVTTGTATGTGLLCWLHWAKPRPSATYGLWFSGRNANARAAVANGISQGVSDVNGCQVIVSVAPPASALHAFNVWIRDL